MQVSAYFFGLRSQMFNNLGNSFVNTAFQIHRVGTSGHVLQTYTDNRLCQNRCRSRTVAGMVVGLGGNFLHQLGTHVCKRAFQFYFLSHRHAVFCDVGGTEFLFDNYITSLRTERNLYGVSQLIHALLQKVAGFHIKLNLFSHDVLFLFICFFLLGELGVKETKLIGFCLLF
ncbi:hypothetical protein Barb6_03071 [Bacteroidales bacterium Barb6]|nr:hypothetical protein Barb6_03071 [Bacteroidales bacterium Barb6]